MKSLGVHLHGKRVGTLEDDARQLVFRYDGASLRSGVHSGLAGTLHRAFHEDRQRLDAGRSFARALQTTLHSGKTRLADGPRAGAEISRRILAATHDLAALPGLRNPKVREIVMRRAERMLGLLEKTAG